MGAVQLQPLSPKQALEWFKSKGLQPTFDWRDLWRACQENAFAISGVTELDLLDDMQDEIGRAIDEGLSFEQFQADAEKILRYHGWWGPAITEDPVARPPAQGKPRQREPPPHDLSHEYRWRAEHRQRAYRGDRRGSTRAWRRHDLPEVQRRRPERAHVRRLSGARRRYGPGRSTILIWGWCTPLLHFGCRCVIESLTDRDLKDFGYAVSPEREIRTRRYRNARTGHTVSALEGVQPGLAATTGTASFTTSCRRI